MDIEQQISECIAAIEQEIAVRLERETVYVYAVAVSHNDDNRELQIPSVGTSIEPAVLDLFENRYILYGKAYICLGELSFLPMLIMGMWNVVVPLSEEIIRDSITSNNRTKLNTFLQNHSDCKIHYFQMREL